MNREKYPELAPIYDKFCEEKAAILAKIEPMRREEEALQRALDESAGKLRVVREKIVAAEGKRLREVSLQIAALERSCGARSLQAGPPA